MTTNPATDPQDATAAATKMREDLQAAIIEAENLVRDKNDEKEAAWILRRCFDKVMPAATAAAASDSANNNAVNFLQLAVDLLKKAIKEGAPLFNDGKITECYTLYLTTAKSTVDTLLELELLGELVEHPTLGVLRLDYDYPAAPGDIDSPESYNYPVIYRVVPGLTFQMAQKGQLTDEVKKEMIDAIEWLTNEAKVTAITGDCGFMMWFQGMARGHTKRPVFLSSLMQLPTISASLCPKHDKILVVTANVQSLRPMQKLINDMVGTKEEHKHFVFVGLETVPFFGVEVEQGLKIDVEKAEPGILEAVKKSIQEQNDADPDRTIRAILFECTELPPYSAATRAETGLPVYDSITTCDFVMKSFLESGNFGRESWYKPWDGQQQEYQFGQELTEEQKKKLVFSPVDEHCIESIGKGLEEVKLIEGLNKMGFNISVEEAIQAIVDKIEIKQAKKTIERVEKGIQDKRGEMKKGRGLARVQNFFVK